MDAKARCRSALPMVILLLAVPRAALARQASRDTMPGYPIRDSAVVSQCSACHAQDSTGRMTRISFARKTPEGWETSIRRMATLNGAQLDPAAARNVLRYLANQQGLSPEELRPGRFEVERRMIDYRYTADATTETTCRACHSMGRVITQRRTREEWSLLVAMHRGYYPIVDFQGFRRQGPRPTDGSSGNHPMDDAITHLARAFPVNTPEWTAWKTTMRSPRIEGAWLLSGTEPGKGAFYGRVTITRAPGTDDEFTTQATYAYVQSGSRVQRTGRATVYTGFQWRGRSTAAGQEPAWREVMMVEPGWQQMSGRWFTGDYDEFGMDVTLTRAGSNVVLAGVHPRGLQAGAAATEITLFGANFPGSMNAAGIDPGPGVRIERVVRASADRVTLLVRAESGAQTGARDLFAAGAPLRNALVVYDTISRIRITPVAGMARVGGAHFPRQYQQFDAVAWLDGADRRPDTNDDVEIGPVAITWSLEEYGVTYDDDDVKFVGSIDRNGLFTPAPDGPNPERSGNRNNIGDVWVVATHTTAGPASRTLRARANLVVTVPLYMRWEPWRLER